MSKQVTPLYIAFSIASDAFDYRYKHGGWLFAVEGRSEYICYALSFTRSQILTHHTTHGLNGIVTSKRTLAEAQAEFHTAYNG
jgi:hypothetical protein